MIEHSANYFSTTLDNIQIFIHPELCYLGDHIYSYKCSIIYFFIHVILQINYCTIVYMRRSINFMFHPAYIVSILIMLLFYRVRHVYNIADILGKAIKYVLINEIVTLACLNFYL